jgi:hypothetical protein
LTFEVLDEEVSNVVWLFVEAPYTLEARKLTFAVEGNFEIRSRAFAISKKKRHSIFIYEKAWSQTLWDRQTASCRLLGTCTVLVREIGQDEHLSTSSLCH